jgi:hypothetical protein
MPTLTAPPSACDVIEVEDDDEDTQENPCEGGVYCNDGFYKRKRGALCHDDKWIYDDEMLPYEIVMALQRRASILQKLRAKKILVAKVIGIESPAEIVMKFLEPQPMFLSCGYLQRLHVSPDRVFLTLKCWFYKYGRVPAPRNLRQLVRIDHRLLKVKTED